MQRKILRQKNRALTSPEILAVIAILLVIISFFLPNVEMGREAARRQSCQHTFKQLMLALLEYEAEQGEFPPAYTVDAEGNRIHSWRTLILPYLEQQILFDTIDLTKPWDDPTNLKARETAVSAYVCPGAYGKKVMTTYLGVIGSDCFFSGAEPRKITDFTDHPKNTIAIIEVPNDQAVHWMSPYDVDKDTVLKMNSKSKMSHPHIAIAALMDGHAKSIPADIDREKLRALLTINGGEEIED